MTKRDVLRLTSIVLEEIAMNVLQELAYRFEIEALQPH